MNLPTTIKFPETFNKSLAAGFDGAFDWSLTQGCFADTKIAPALRCGLLTKTPTEKNHHDRPRPNHRSPGVNHFLRAHPWCRWRFIARDQHDVFNNLK